jgi:hypothetical protein
VYDTGSAAPSGVEHSRSNVLGLLGWRNVYQSRFSLSYSLDPTLERIRAVELIGYPPRLARSAAGVWSRNDPIMRSAMVNMTTANASGPSKTALDRAAPGGEPRQQAATARGDAAITADAGWPPAADSGRGDGAKKAFFFLAIMAYLLHIAAYKLSIPYRRQRQQRLGALVAACNLLYLLCCPLEALICMGFLG